MSEPARTASYGGGGQLGAPEPRGPAVLHLQVQLLQYCPYLACSSGGAKPISRPAAGVSRPSERPADERGLRSNGKVSFESRIRPVLFIHDPGCVEQTCRMRSVITRDEHRRTRAERALMADVPPNSGSRWRVWDGGRE